MTVIPAKAGIHRGSATYTQVESKVEQCVSDEAQCGPQIHCRKLFGVPSRGCTVTQVGR
jgi:hypothetical protein